MNIRFYNARICAMENDMDIVYGELWVKGNRVYYTGPSKPADIRFDREIDLSGDIIIPGFKNAHAHSAMTFLRSLADDMPLLRWLESKVFPMEAKLKPEYIPALCTLAIMEYLSGGITAAFDMYMYPEEMAKASIASGFRTALCGTETAAAWHGENALSESYKRYNSMHELISYSLGFHAEYTGSPELFKGIAAVAHKLEAPVFCHNSESTAEVAACISRTGMTPTAYLDSFGLFEHGGGGYHCVHFTESDMEIFLKRKMTVITCPGSNCKLASGIPPVKRFLERGIPVALGTDSPASNNCLDMFREMFLTTALQKVKEEDASAVPAETVLRMACVTGAEVMGLHECVSLAPGMLADLTVMGLNAPNMRPINNIPGNIVYSGGRQNIRLTMVNGQILYENGNFYIGSKPEDIYNGVSDIVKAVSGID